MVVSIKEIIREGWRYLLVVYLVGCIVPLLMDGVPNWYYLIPIKVSAIGIGWLLGVALYRARTVRERPTEPFHELWFAAFGHGVFSMTLCAIFAAMIMIVCWLLRIDPTPFYGFK